MQRETNTVINIEEVGDFGIVDIAAANVDDINAAVERIKLITTLPEVGEIYEGTVKTITDFGAFVEFLPNTDGLLHVSEIAYRRIEDVNEVLSVGDKIKVKLIEIDEKTGKYRLSHRALLPKPEGYEDEKPQRRGGGDRNRDRNRDRERGRDRDRDREHRGGGGGNRERGGRENRHGNSNQQDGHRHRQERRELPDFPEMD
jgi:polyribonucleotide nucleotidyltransferase